MIKWREAYERIRGLKEFNQWFGGLPMNGFRFLAYSQPFVGVAAASTPGVLGATSGPTLMTFPAGAVILGVTAAAYQEQTASGTFTYAPSLSPGRRDLFAMSLQYTNDEQITPNGLTMAEALLGSGGDTIFPGKELLIPPSQGLLCAVASYAPAPTLTVQVVYHCMVPRMVA